MCEDRFFTRNFFEPEIGFLMKRLEREGLASKMCNVIIQIRNKNIGGPASNFNKPGEVNYQKAMLLQLGYVIYLRHDQY